MQILEKLKTIQTELKVPKGQHNSYGGYNYRSCEDILESLKPLLAVHNCALTLQDEIVKIGERYYIKATAALFDCENGEQYSNTAYAREENSKKGMDASQITGAASSYARKYALSGLLCVDDNKDADTNEYTRSQGNYLPKPEKKSPAPRCENCGLEVGNYSTIGEDGKKIEWTAEELAAKSKEAYGKVLCKKCRGEQP